MKVLGAIIALLPLALVAWYFRREEGGGFALVSSADAAELPSAAAVDASPVTPDTGPGWFTLPAWMTSADPLAIAPAADAVATTAGGIVLDPGTGSTWRTPPAGQIYASAFTAAEQAYGLPAGMLSSQAYQESRYNPNAFNKSSGAIGLMQFEPATAADYGIDPRDPYQSIDGAGRYLRDLYKKFGSWSGALAAYDWGMGNLQRKGIDRAPTETKNYFSQILARIGLTA